MTIIPPDLDASFLSDDVQLPPQLPYERPRPALPAAFPESTNGAKPDDGRGSHNLMIAVVALGMALVAMVFGAILAMVGLGALYAASNL